MTRLQLIRRILRQVYGGQPSIDSNITDNLVNNWMTDAIAASAVKNYQTNLGLDGVAYVNNSFYTTFLGLTVSQTADPFTYQLTLPQIPIGIGNNEGIGTLQFVDSSGNISDPAIPLSENQVGYYRNMRAIPNKILYYPESIYLYAISTLQLNNFTGKVRMISGGNSADLNSLLNVPDETLADITQYVSKQLSWERQQPKIPTNDGTDA
jgi:hypothetical protein